MEELVLEVVNSEEFEPKLSVEAQNRIPQFQKQERCGIYVFVKKLKHLRQLQHYGTLYYVSKKMRYALLYVNREDVCSTKAKLEKQNFVIKVEVSEKANIKVDYQSQKRGEF